MFCRMWLTLQRCMSVCRCRPIWND